MIGRVPSPWDTTTDILGSIFRGARVKPCGHLKQFAALLDEAEDGNAGRPDALAVIAWLRDQLGLEPGKGNP